MSKKISIGPFTRINGLWHLKVEINDNVITDAWSMGTNFRGLELILKGRDPRDAPYLTQRICGICSSAHALVSSRALENAFNLEVPRNGALIKNLIFASDLVQGHIRHFYFFVIPDYIHLPENEPFKPSYVFNERLSAKGKERILNNYRKAAEISQSLHEMLVIFGGKTPHNHGILAGGATVPPDADKIRLFGSMLSKAISFIEEALMPDTEALGEAYTEYFQLGEAHKNLITFGMFFDPDIPQENLYPSGIIRNGGREDMDKDLINEQARYSFYENDEPLRPLEGKTIPEFQEGKPYSWIKAPRYGKDVYEMGPLARQIVRKKYNKSFSAMDRITARSLETLEVAREMEGWLKELEPGAPVYTDFEIPSSAEGEGYLDVMRGALQHSVRVSNKKISHYQIVTPTTWNCSPRDNEGQRGALEEALVGTPVEDPENPVEIGRVSRSLDVCGSCAVHIAGVKGLSFSQKII